MNNTNKAYVQMPCLHKKGDLRLSTWIMDAQQMNNSNHDTVQLRWSFRKKGLSFW